MIVGTRARLIAFGRFWWDFVVGDDGRLAVAVVAALAITYAVARTAVEAWWIVPAAVVLVLPLSLLHATRKRR
jgi:hypothetical protein